MGWN